MDVFRQTEGRVTPVAATLTPMQSAAPLRARAVTVTRGPNIVLDSINLTVAGGETIGLVGPNGVGKSTLLGVLAGRIQPDRGSVELTPPTTTVGLLPQEPRRDRVELVSAYLDRRTGATAATAELDAATTALADREMGADTRYDHALQRWLSLGVADLPARIGEVWADLGLADDLLDQPTASLSGGEAARVGLAALLLSRFDVYLLDEPTNDLDLDGLGRLERWIGALESAVVLVSHDRTFLARTVTAVVELDEFTHRATRFAGGWQAYLDEKAAAERHAWERFEEYDAKRSALAGRAQREREWANQGRARVRTSDERDKFIRHHQINQTEQLAGRAARTERAIERLAVVDKPRVPWQLHLDIATARRSGDIVARLTDVTVQAGCLRARPDRPAHHRRRAGRHPRRQRLGQDHVVERDPRSSRPRAGNRAARPERRRRRDPADPRRLLAAAPATQLLRVFQDLTGLDAGEARTLLAKFGLVADHVLRSPGDAVAG